MADETAKKEKQENFFDKLGLPETKSVVEAVLPVRRGHGQSGQTKKEDREAMRKRKSLSGAATIGADDWANEH